MKGRKRAKGLEPSPEAWKAAVLPLHYARNLCYQRLWKLWKHMIISAHLSYIALLLK